MPALDVTDVLTDPDFVETLVCRRTVQTVGNDGDAISTPTDTNFTGAPIPTKSLEMHRQDGSEYASGSMTFITTFQLTTGDRNAGTTADQVVFGGKAYTIVDVDQWPYGAGFVQATGELLPLNP